MYRYITNLEDALKSLEIINKCPYVGLDIETKGLDCFTDEILLVQIACDEYFTEDPISTFVYDARLINLREFFDKLKTSVIGHNLKFDLKYLRYLYGWFPETLFDTMIAESLITNGIGKQMPSLNDLCFKYLGQTLVKEIRNTFQDQIAFFTDQQLNYAADDAEILLKLYTILQTELLNKELTKISELEFELLPVIVDMELTGVNFSREVWQKCIKQAEIGKINAESLVREEFSKAKTIKVKGKSKGLDIVKEFNASEINLNSPQQVLSVLRKLGVPVPNTSFDELSLQNHPAVTKLLKYRKYAKMLSTYGEAYFENINPLTNRIHSEWNQIGAQSGRFSSQKPNLTQLPNPGKNPDDDINYRDAFIATEGYEVITADYSQVELRILGSLSKEPEFIDAYKNNKDLHSRTASKISIPIYGSFLSEDEVNAQKKSNLEVSHLRGIGKNSNFAMAYQSGAWNLSRKFKIPIDQATGIVESFHTGYPVLHKWILWSNQQVIINGYSDTVWGRKRHFIIPSYSDPEFDKKLAEIKREGTNNRIQGTSADITKLAMIKLYKELKSIGGRLLLCVHDEIVCEVPKDRIDEGKEAVRKSMCDAFTEIIPDIPIEIDLHVGQEWAK